MKKIVIFILIFVVNSLWAKDPFSKIKDINKIIELANNTDLLIEGKIISKEYIYINRKTKKLINPDNIDSNNLGKVVIITKFTVRVLEDFKKNVKFPEIKIWILGGILNLKGEERVNLVTHSAYPLLDEGDVMIMGLNKNKNTSPVNMLDNEYIRGYYFYKAEQLQIPSSDKMIEDVENGELEKAKKKIYEQKLKSLEEPNSNIYPSYDELEQNLLNASIEMKRNIEVKKQFIKMLKKSLRRVYE